LKEPTENWRLLRRSLDQVLIFKELWLWIKFVYLKVENHDNLKNRLDNQRGFGANLNTHPTLVQTNTPFPWVQKSAWYTTHALLFQSLKMKFGHLSYIFSKDVNANRKSDVPHLVQPHAELAIREHLVLLNVHGTHDRRDAKLNIFEEGFAMVHGALLLVKVINERGKPNAWYKRTGWVWGITG
jgi:hypothetical protein